MMKNEEPKDVQERIAKAAADARVYGLEEKITPTPIVATKIAASGGNASSYPTTAIDASKLAPSKADILDDAVKKLALNVSTLSEKMESALYKPRPYPSEENYTYTIRKDGDVFVGTCAEFYLLSVSALTSAMALNAIQYLVLLVLDEHSSLGEEIPQPGEIRKDQ